MGLIRIESLLKQGERGLNCNDIQSLQGSVGLRLVVHSTSIVFVCSHFAAGQNEVSRRAFHRSDSRQ